MSTRTIDAFYKNIVYALNLADDEERLERIDFILKNMRQDINKLIISIKNVNSLLSEKGGFQNGVNVTCAIHMEYFFFKASSLVDNAYKIYELFAQIQPKKKLTTFSDHLSQFAEKTQDAELLTLVWYKNFTEIRNFLIHDGLSILPMFDKSELYFQVYDKELDHLVESQYMTENGAVHYLSYSAHLFSTTLKFLQVLCDCLSRKHFSNDLSSLSAKYQEQFGYLSNYTVGIDQIPIQEKETLDAWIQSIE